MTEDAEQPATDDREARLIEGVLRREESAFRTLYGSHAQAMYRVALRMTGGRDADAQDAVQEAWRRGVAGLASFEKRSSLRTWLSAIVVRCALEQGRKTARLTGQGSSHRSGSAGPADHLGVIQAVDLERAFEDLAPGYQAVLVLHDLEGYRHADIAKLLQITEGTSKSQLSRARARMRAALGEDYVAE